MLTEAARRRDEESLRTGEDAEDGDGDADEEEDSQVIEIVFRGSPISRESPSI